MLVARMIKMRNRKSFTENPERNKPFQKPRNGCENNIKIDFKEGGVNWIHQVQNRGVWQVLLNTVVNLYVYIKKV